MTRLGIAFPLACAWLCLSSTMTANSGSISANARPAPSVNLDKSVSTLPAGVIELAEVGSFTEGIVLDAAGNAYFSHADQVTRLSPDGELALWWSGPRPNGHKILPDGRHVVCSTGAVVFLNADGKPAGEPIIECEGQPLRQPNDIALDPIQGGFYFTDPGGSRQDRQFGMLHYVSAEGVVSRVASGFDVPNGLVVDPVRKRLYLAETDSRRVLKFAITGPGQLSAREPWIALEAISEISAGRPDGLTLDRAGNLYVAMLGAGCIAVFDPDGERLQTIPTGYPATSNLAFADIEQSALLVTGSAGRRSDTGGLLRVPLR